MSFNLPGESNPFQAPTARIGGPDPSLDLVDIRDAELIRRDHISREASIKSLGILNYLGAFFGAIGTIGLLVVGSGALPLNLQNNPNALSPEAMRQLSLGLALLYLVLTLVNGGLGYGLRRFQPWARWTMIVLTSLSLLYTLGVSVIAGLANPIVGVVSMILGSLIPGYILNMMASAKGAMIFSPEYKRIIKQTPHVKQKTSLLVKIFLVLLVALLLFIVVASIMSANK